VKHAAPRYQPWSADEASAIVSAESSREGALLPVLHALQATFGYIPDAAVPIIAQVMNLSRAEVHGVITFYHDFKNAPQGKHVLKICRAEACQARGGETIAERAEQKLGIAFGETTPDKRVTLEATYCLGLCACGPNAMLNGEPIARIDNAKLDSLLVETNS
jgi:formate dehydrogenase subunit gamma